jgi:hypothetical protein
VKLMRKGLNLIIIVLLICNIMLVAAATGTTAVPTASTIRIDGKEVAFDAYMINGNNYFKLRDLAMAFVGSAAQISIDWAGDSNSIYLRTNQTYVPVGGELGITTDKSNMEASLSTATVYLDGTHVNLTAYNIGGNNYFKLRDLGTAIDFDILYNEATKDIDIDTTMGYYMAGVFRALPDAYYNVTNDYIVCTKLEAGSISVYQYTKESYSVIALNISTENDMIILRNAIEAFTDSPEKVIEELSTNNFGGKSVIELDGKTFECISIGNTKTVNVKWSI